MTIIDTWWNWLQRRRERKHPYQVLLTCSGQELEQQVVDSLHKSGIYQVHKVDTDEIKQVSANYEIIIYLNYLSQTILTLQILSK